MTGLFLLLLLLLLPFVCFKNLVCCMSIRFLHFLSLHIQSMTWSCIFYTKDLSCLWYSLSKRLSFDHWRPPCHPVRFCYFLVTVTKYLENWLRKEEHFIFSHNFRACVSQRWQRHGSWNVTQIVTLRPTGSQFDFSILFSAARDSSWYDCVSQDQIDCPSSQTCICCCCYFSTSEMSPFKARLE